MDNSGVVRAGLVWVEIMRIVRALFVALIMIAVCLFIAGNLDVMSWGPENRFAISMVTAIGFAAAYWGPKA